MKSVFGGWLWTCCSSGDTSPDRLDRLDRLEPEDWAVSRDDRTKPSCKSRTTQVLPAPSPSLPCRPCKRPDLLDFGDCEATAEPLKDTKGAGSSTPRAPAMPAATYQLPLKAASFRTASAIQEQVRNLSKGSRGSAARNLSKGSSSGRSTKAWQEVRPEESLPGFPLLIPSTEKRSKSLSTRSTARSTAESLKRAVDSVGTNSGGTGPSADGKSPWSPGTSRSFSKSSKDAVIIFDWDDTLCPTSWALEQIRNCPDTAALLEAEKAHTEQLDAHAAAVVALLRAARSCARVAVVTLATKEFFTQSAETFLEGARIKELFRELGIKVYFAERAQETNKATEVAAKSQAMTQCLSHLYGSQLMRWNVLAIGDSTVELEALKKVLAGKWRTPLCKTLKFDARPSLDQLTTQIQTVTPHLADMMACSKDFDRFSLQPWG
ncbi:unnamed protein product [Effrenium voratum]|uniref:Uncharacterized protein n=1 Tax=Effrenium voratum TaxID=2562239 RepID=A0AA36IJ83_9DINO|nr:unnamed protein product [Effrenium voratum]